ncbi:MAG: cytochrome oxidase subunit III [Dehalococcoidia bacterium]|nr:MAG: cytochrome oxidase subunit III [Dehalococcoidia bacterium]
MPIRKQGRESQFQIFGWVLFLACSILFIVDSIAAGSPWGLVGSVFFLLGCVIFLIPFTWKRR